MIFRSASIADILISWAAIQLKEEAGRSLIGSLVMVAFLIFSTLGPVYNDAEIPVP